MSPSIEELNSLIGRTYGKLTILSLPDKISGQHKRKAVCKCVCGRVKEYILSHVKRGHTKSCGCDRQRDVHIVNRKHGFANSPIYKVWATIKKRCNSPKADGYELYGGRGIRVCEEWQNNAQSFCEWANMNGYRKGLQIDRIDPNGNYEPSNCRLVTPSQNARNRRISDVYEYNGETRHLAEWAEIVNIKYYTLSSRIKSGWSLKETLETPCRKYDEGYKSRKKLIAAAPHMLEALKKICEMNYQQAEDQYGDRDKAKGWACVRVAEAAIKKATI